MTPAPRVVVLANVRSSGSAQLGSAALAALRERTRVVGELEIQGEPGDGERIAALLAEHEPDVLVAAGGDGTIGLALAALLEAKGRPERVAIGPGERTALGMLPLGTGNNAARSFGLRALRDGPAALALAVDAIARGPRRAVDVGVVDGRPFLGSVAIGMDADVLALRNRLRARGGPFGAGYSLYLGAALASLAARHGGAARLALDGAEQQLHLLGLCVVNAPVYAGPIRFDGASDAADGQLDVLALTSGAEYVAEYATGWLRYLRVRAGRRAAPSARLVRAREVVVRFAEAVAGEADGEEIGEAVEYRIAVRPGAVGLCVPPQAE